MNKHIEAIIAGVCGLLAGVILIFTIHVKTPNYEIETRTEVITETVDNDMELPEKVQIEYVNDLGEVVTLEDYPTVEEIDGGGNFEELSLYTVDNFDQYHDLGAIETDVDTSSPSAFAESTLQRCIYANNYFGAQCVSLFRAFSWAYAGRDITTCGTGLAKGMMNCYEENAGDDYDVIWNTDDIVAGTWAVFDGSLTGHVCMALDKPVNGYVACLGENQGGKKCEKGGSATNIIKLSLKNYIGGYIPVDYITPVVPEVLPDTSH